MEVVDEKIAISLDLSHILFVISIFIFLAYIYIYINMQIYKLHI